MWAAHFPDGTHVPTNALIVPQTLLILLSNAYGLSVCESLLQTPRDEGGFPLPQFPPRMLLLPGRSSIRMTFPRNSPVGPRPSPQIIRLFAYLLGASWEEAEAEESAHGGIIPTLHLFPTVIPASTWERLCTPVCQHPAEPSLHKDF